MQIKMLGRGMMWLTVAAFLVSAGAARAVGPEVRDSAGLFSPAAVQQADAAIQKLQKELGKELLIETFAGVPENRKADYRRSREEFFTSFVRERAQAARLNGIYVMVMKEEPPHRMRIQIGLGEATRQRAFLASDRDQLVRVLQASFRENKYDEGLTSAVAFVERTVRSHLSSTTAGSVAPSGVTRNAPSSAPAASAEHSAAAPSSGPNLLKWAFIIGGVLVAVFLVRMLSGAMGGGGGGGLSGGSMGGMGGGGFFSSLLGGIGGAMAGNWLYDRFTGDNSRSHHDGGSSLNDAPSDVGGDYSSSGGDVDSGSGGGDFGGGGGDFGGGGGDV